MGLTTALSGAGLGTLHGINSVNNARMIGRTTPAKTNQAASETELLNALEGYLKDNARTPINEFNIDEHTPKPGIEGFKDVLTNPSHYSGSTKTGDNNYSVTTNPNADRSYFAHELGHVAAQQFDFGNIVHKLDNQPAIKNALLGALLVAPGTAALLEAGDDDMDTSLAIGLAAASPTILKESLATSRLTSWIKLVACDLGQRGRLAVAYSLTWVLSLLLLVQRRCNIFDEDTTGELPM